MYKNSLTAGLWAVNLWLSDKVLACAELIRDRCPAKSLRTMQRLPRMSSCTDCTESPWFHWTCSSKSVDGFLLLCLAVATPGELHYAFWSFWTFGQFRREFFLVVYKYDALQPVRLSPLVKWYLRVMHWGSLGCWDQANMIDTPSQAEVIILLVHFSHLSHLLHHLHHSHQRRHHFYWCHQFFPQDAV